jgi:hypothetical protein
MDAACIDQLAAMDATALVAELRALSDAGSSFDEQAECCSHLCDAAPLLPAGAAADDAVRTVVSALTRGVQHAPLQTAGCTTLAFLVSAAPAAGATAGATGVAAVLAALRMHSGSADVQSSACAALAELVASDATNRATAGAAGGLVAMVAAMTRHAADANVALNACDALAVLTLENAQNVAAALDAGAVTAMLAAMRAFPAAVHLGCCALSSISGLAGTLGGTLTDGAAVDVAVAAMRAHAGELELQCHGCNLLSWIFGSSGDRNADGSWAQRGKAALTAVVAALKTDGADADLLYAGCAAISGLMRSIDGNIHAAVQSEKAPACVCLLHIFPPLSVRGPRRRRAPRLHGGSLPTGAHDV